MRRFGMFRTYKGKIDVLVCESSSFSELRFIMGLYIEASPAMANILVLVEIHEDFELNKATDEDPFKANLYTKTYDEVMNLASDAITEGETA